jgi:hypothetical protein
MRVRLRKFFRYIRVNAKEFFYFFWIQFLVYGFICWNTRAIADAWFGQLILTDGIIAFFNFKLTKKIAQAESEVAMWGYISGGICGSVTSVFLTKFFMHQ